MHACMYLFILAAVPQYKCAKQLNGRSLQIYNSLSQTRFLNSLLQ